MDSQRNFPHQKVCVVGCSRKAQSLQTLLMVLETCRVQSVRRALRVWCAKGKLIMGALPSPPHSGKMRATEFLERWRDVCCQARVGSTTSRVVSHLSWPIVSCSLALCPASLCSPASGAEGKTTKLPLLLCPNYEHQRWSLLKHIGSNGPRASNLLLNRKKI